MNIVAPAAAIVTWLSGVMLQASPPERRIPANDPNAAAFVEAEKMRYEELADAVARVVYDPETAPLYSGPHGRAKTAIVLLTVAWYESGFRKDVDLGIGPRSRGDGGRSCTVFQFNIGKGKTREGYTCDEMFQDRTLAVRSALAVVRSSISMCKSLSPEYRLSAYTAGRCEDGQQQSKSRVETARRWIEKYAPPLTDEEAIEEGALEARRELSSLYAE